MSNQINFSNNYSELRSKSKYYIDLYNDLYRLNTENEDELKKIYNMIKLNLIDSKKYSIENIIRDILIIIQYNNRYAKSYMRLVQHISKDYRVKDIKTVPETCKCMLFKDNQVKLKMSDCFNKEIIADLDYYAANTIYGAIASNDLKRFISFTENELFNKNQVLKSKLYSISDNGYSLLELCCYYGAVDCFKFLRTNFKSEITQTCLYFLLLGGNPDIISECLKYQKPDKECMKYAIISHNIDFVTFLRNEHNIEINLEYCEIYNNLESFLVYLDITNDVNSCLIYSPLFDIPSLCENVLFLGANINSKDSYGNTVLNIAVHLNNIALMELLLSHGANINEKDKFGDTALHLAASYNNNKMIKFLLSHGANINEKDINGEIALHKAMHFNNIDAIKLLLSHGANVNEKNKNGRTPLYDAMLDNNKKLIKILLSYRANVNEKNRNGDTLLHLAACKDDKK
ncbi:ankyrin repeat protein, putative [Trichomonas vaginalis G3]|uniref:Ankyrin repeat protein, putative n=1 Tax=Trichomonas vaginalis (strain ATCC PRA-98 / G3) TaxID=412133 RepID=A2DPN4_TRIV3|nr:spectrin binding [Trichomonas vaginalis G3]EAY17634.1 ankyrin repeat protein, putative [Trichomonas vaginalis G3]KAI5486122.1 spectrin binding [Trichomonas vaginalis G3]|eukprot:XP_001329769.1 ankyrin repeat protein [Trichomonas vaginalis G3]